MKLIRDFHCDRCGSDLERYVDSETRSIACDCGSEARRVIGTPRIALEGITGSFPGAHDRWARVREENARITAKRNS